MKYILIRTIVFLSLSLNTVCVANAEQPKIVKPSLYTDAVRPDIEDKLGPYNRGPFARSMDEVRLDIFFRHFHPEVEKLAIWAKQLLQEHYQHLTIQFHYVLRPTTSPPRQQYALPVLKELGAKPDYMGALAQKTGLRDLPAAQLSYQQYMWRLRTDQIQNATLNLLNKLGY